MHANIARSPAGAIYVGDQVRCEVISACAPAHLPALRPPSRVLSRIRSACSVRVGGQARLLHSNDSSAGGSSAGHTPQSAEVCAQTWMLSVHNCALCSCWMTGEFSAGACRMPAVQAVPCSPAHNSLRGILCFGAMQPQPRGYAPACSPTELGLSKSHGRAVPAKKLAVASG